MNGVLVVPPVPALLPAYASLTDPVAPLRAAITEAVQWLVDGCAVVGVLAEEPQAFEVADHLLAAYDGEVVQRACTPGGDHSLEHEHVDALLVLANGSARRGEKAPGHLDERARAFDAGLEEALMMADCEVLESIDYQLGTELMAAGLPALQALGAIDPPVVEVQLDYAGDPFGVQYWVVRWQCDS